MTPASNSNTEGMEEVKKTLRDIQEAINRPMATQTKEIEKRWQMLEKNLEEIRKTIKPRELPRAVGGNRETTNKNEGATDPVADARGHTVFPVPGQGSHGTEMSKSQGQDTNGVKIPIPYTKSGVCFKHQREDVSTGRRSDWRFSKSQGKQVPLVIE